MLDRGLKDTILAPRAILVEVRRAKKLDVLKEVQERARASPLERKTLRIEIFRRKVDLFGSQKEAWKRFGKVEVIRGKNGRFVGWKKR